jgi:hypothetical protein
MRYLALVVASLALIAIGVLLALDLVATWLLGVLLLLIGAVFAWDVIATARERTRS